MSLSLYTAHQHLQSTHWTGLPTAASLWLLADALKRGSLDAGAVGGCAHRRGH